MIDWSQWVPASAIVAAAVAYIFRQVEAWRARKRELKGLLRLLAVEIAWNRQVLEFFTERSGDTLVELAEGAGLASRAWEENRARIAVLINDDADFQDLADFFMNIAVFEKERLIMPEDRNHALDKQQSLLLHIDNILAQGKEAKKAVDRGVGTEVKPQLEAPVAPNPPKEGG